MPPQDVPYEAGETQSFTPASLKQYPDAPTFAFRTPTPRDKRQHRRMQREEGVQRHSNDALRAAMLDGLKQMWSQATYDEHAPRLETYWEMQDQFALQQKDDPDLVWSYPDPAEEKAIQDLVARIVESWRPVRKLLADNADFNELTPKLMIAVALRDWSGLSVTPLLEGGYVSLESVDAMQEALEAYEESKGHEPGTAWLELFAAATTRMYLDSVTEKNSASPSRSETPPKNSKGAGRGKSPRSASSKPKTATA